MTDQGGPFLITQSAQAIVQTRELGRKAAKLDIRGVYLDTMLEVLRRLTTEPLEWGDPEGRTRKKGGMYCHGVLPPLIVNFVVYEEEKVVLIWQVRPVPGSLLDLAK